MRTAGRWARRATASVRVRVAVVTAVIFAVVLVAASAWLLNVTESRLTDKVREDTEQAVQEQAQRLLIGAEPAAAVAGTAFQAPLPAILTTDGVVVVSYRTPLGAEGGTASLPTQGLPPPPTGAGAGVSVSSGDQLVKTFVSGSSERTALPIDALTAQQLGITSGGPFLVSTLSVDNGVALAALSSLGEIRQTIDSLRAMLWWVVPALVLLVGVLAWFVVGRALRPVHDVTRQLASIGSDSLHERVPVPPSADEVGELAVTMNSMLDRLESATLVSRQLVSDASHELRTPIAVLRTELEVARRDPATDWEAVSLGMLDEVERLQGLVDDLLLLARANERGMHAEPVDVVDVVTQVAARRRRVPVTVEVTGEPVVEADEAALRRAIDHLVANAARHASSEVRLSVSEADANLDIRVDDDGTGIAEADRERVLERFVRLDEGRARDGGGSGLGLAVANDVAVAHGGVVRIERSVTLGGASVTLTLPVTTRTLALTGPTS